MHREQTTTVNLTYISRQHQVSYNRKIPVLHFQASTIVQSEENCDTEKRFDMAGLSEPISQLFQGKYIQPHITMVQQFKQSFFCFYVL